MSNVIFPTLPGLLWSTTKTPEFNTRIQRSVTLRELRASFTSTPVYNFSLSYEVLRQDTTYSELSQLMGFFMARQGSWDSFLYADPNDTVATLMSFGTGDGAMTEFQITRTFGAFTEQVANIAASPSIYVGGVLQTSGYTIDSRGAITFDSAPAAAAALTWSGTYYYRCRFKEDSLEFGNFMRLLWEAQKVEFIGSLGSKI